MRYLIGFLLLANLAFFFWYPGVDNKSVLNNRLPPLPPEIRPLVLLSEREPTNTAPLDEDSQPIAIDANTVLTTPESKQRLCLTIGPYFDIGQVKVAKSLLGKQHLAPRMRTGNLEEPAGYWVYMPAMPADRAREIVADLDKQGMKDYFIGKHYVISLGIFSDQQKAATRQQQVATMGYDSRLNRRYRTRQVYWLDIEETTQPLQVNPVWLLLLKANPKIAAQKVSCE